MALYEHIFIARQDVQTQQVDTIADDFTKIIENFDGKVVNREYWGLRTLTYKIKKNRKGHYVMLHLDAPAAALAELERNARLNEDVLRYMTIRVEAHEEGPSIMMQKPPRDERPRREGDRGSRSRDFGTLELEDQSDE